MCEQIFRRVTSRFVIDYLFPLVRARPSQVNRSASECVIADWRRMDRVHTRWKLGIAAVLEVTRLRFAQHSFRHDRISRRRYHRLLRRSVTQTTTVFRVRADPSSGSRRPPCTTISTHVDETIFYLKNKKKEGSLKNGDASQDKRKTVTEEEEKNDDDDVR